MKKLLALLVLAVVFAGIAFGILALITPEPPKKRELPPPPETGAVSAALIDGNTGEILADKEGNLKSYPASTTKILTCIIALEEGKDKLEQNAVITPRAMKQDGTNLGIRPDMPLTLHQMLYGMMLVSGNDSAVATAETVGGSYDRFIEMMNEKAAAIGAKNSHFANPNGLTNPNHYTTAEDMAKIAAYAMKNPAFRDIVKRKTYPMTYRNGIYRNVVNRNEFLSSGYAGANGIKTGMTEAAGDCLVASAERDGKLMIVVLYNDSKRWQDVKTWLDYGFTAAKAEDEYQAALAAEPAIYKFVNRVLKRLFPTSPALRIIFVVVTLITAFVLVQNVYHYVQVRQQEAELYQERDRLLKEKEDLETKKADLEDPAKLEKKARDELGLVKPGEVPYVP